jgi:hypothetical protein
MSSKRDPDFSNPYISVGEREMERTAIYLDVCLRDILRLASLSTAEGVAKLMRNGTIREMLLYIQRMPGNEQLFAEELAQDPIFDFENDTALLIKLRTAFESHITSLNLTLPRKM